MGTLYLWEVCCECGTLTTFAIRDEAYPLLNVRLGKTPDYGTDMLGVIAAEFWRGLSTNFTKAGWVRVGGAVWCCPDCAA